MGKTRNTGYLQNIVQYDGSNNIILPSLVGTGTRMVVTAANGTLSYQDIPTVSNIGGVPTTRTITINGTSQDLSANRTWTLYTDDISEDGSPVNLWFTNARARSAISVSGSLSYDSGTGVISYTTPSTTGITEGTNLYYTDARVGSYLTANSYATQNYVSTQINNLVNGAPGLLDTLDELAQALGDDPNFSTTVTTALSNRLRIDVNNQGLTSTQKGYGRTNLGVVIGTDVQAWDADLDAIAALSGTSGFLKKTAANTWSLDTNTYLTSYTETDPYRVTAVAVSGTSTKTITLTRADSSTVTTTWTDIDTDTNTYVTSAAFSGGTLTLTRNDAGTVTVSLDGRYLPLAGGTLTGALSGTSATFSGIVGVNGASEAGWALKSNGNLKVDSNSGTTVLQVNDTSTGGKTWSLISAGAGNTHSIPAGTFYLRNSSDGTTALQIASTGAATFSSSVTASSFVKLSGTSSQFLKADGSVDSNTYLTSYTESDTLATVTGRGASTSVKSTFSNGVIVSGSYQFGNTYGYSEYSTNLSNSVSDTTTWVKLGTSNPFSLVKIYYRTGNSSAEETGEIRISSTCTQPFIEWSRNTYNPMCREVRARMTGGCGSCEIWVLVSHGTSFSGANTYFTWQVHDGNDSNFIASNTTGTPGTGTNQVSLNTTDGYFYRSTGNIGIQGTITASSGSFTGPLTIKSGNGNQLLLNNSGERFTQINFSNNTVSKANIWWDDTNTELVLLANSSGTGHLKIASNGVATFSNNISAANLSGTNTGDQTLAGLGGLPLSGGTMTGDIQMGNNQNRVIKFRTASAWDYSLKGVNDDFFIQDNPGKNYLSLYYNGGGGSRYIKLMDSIRAYAGGNTYLDNTTIFTGSAQYATGDGVFWEMTPQANGPKIRLKYHGGTTDREGILGWQDNSGNNYSALRWQDSAVLVYGTLTANSRIFATATNGGIQFSGSGYTLNPSGMMIGQYVSGMGYIQAPSAGRVEIWNGATENVVTFNNDKSTVFYGTPYPYNNGGINLGSSSNRWATVFTSDLSLSNGIGDYTIVEGENDLFLYNNKQNKVYKFMLQEVDPKDATPKMSE